MNGEQRPGLYLAHEQNVPSLRILRMFKGEFSLHADQSFGTDIFISDVSYTKNTMSFINQILTALVLFLLIMLRFLTPLFQK